MYKCKITKTAQDVGQSIEEKVRMASQSNTPLEAISPMIYTNAKDGVLPQHDIRSDRQEIALDAINHYEASEAAKTDTLNIDCDNDLKGYVEPSNPN